MRVIYIALKDLIITVKDKKAMTSIIMMPLILIFVLGMALSSAFKSDGGSIKSFDVAVVDKDGGRFAKEFKQVLETDNIKKLLKVKYLEYDKAADMVKNGELAAMIVIPEGYSESYAKGTQVKLNIYEDPGRSLQAGIVRSIVKSYTSTISSINGSMEAISTVFSEYKFNGSIDVNKIVSVVDENTDKLFKQNSIEEQKEVSSMQYYSAAMLVMYALFIAMLGTASIIEEREKKTLLRLMTTTVSKRTIILGKLLGLFIIGILDVSVLIIFTKHVFNTDWGNSVAGIIMLSGALLFAVCGMAMFIASIFKTAKAVQGVSSPVVMIMSFLGGSMFPIYAMPDGMQMVSKIVPNNLALRGYISLMLGKGADAVILPSIVLVLFGTIMLTIGIFKLKLD